MVMTTEQQKYDALKTAVEPAKSCVRSAAEEYPTVVMRDTDKAIVAMIDEIEESDG